MSSRPLRCLVATLAVLSLSGAAASAQEIVANRLIVKFDAAAAGDVGARLANGGAGGTARGAVATLDGALHAAGVLGGRPILGATTGAAVAARRRYARVPRATPPDLDDVYVLELAPGTDVAAAAAALAARPEVVYAHPDHIGAALLVPNDPHLPCTTPPCQPEDWQWDMFRVRAPEAWDLTRGAGVVIALIDTGVNAAHQDLAAHVWHNPGEAANGVDDDGNGFVDDLAGWDFVTCEHFDSGGTCLEPTTPDADPSDVDNHGTAVAGVAAAVGNNGLAIAGMAYEAHVMPVRAVDRDFRVTESALIPALAYAADNGARVIQMSLLIAPTPALHDAIQYAAALDVLLVAAGGNSGTSTIFYPAGYPEVVAVASTNVDDLRSSFSTFNDDIELAAPGERVAALKGITPGSNEIFTSLSGTSVASPHASGLAALLWSWQPALTADQVRAALCGGAVDLGPAGRDPSFGCGRIDAARSFLGVCGADVCGDGVWEPACGEACDDGNTDGTDCCAADCRARALGAPCVVVSKDSAKCTTAIGTQARKYAQVRHMELERCFARVLKDLAAGKGTARAAEACRKRLDPASPSAAIARAAARFVAQVGSRCAGLAVADVGPPCDPGATTFAEVEGCVILQHDVAVDAMVAAEYRDACALVRAAGLESAFPRLCGGS